MGSIRPSSPISRASVELDSTEDQLFFTGSMYAFDRPNSGSGLPLAPSLLVAVFGKFPAAKDDAESNTSVAAAIMDFFILLSLVELFSLVAER